MTTQMALASTSQTQTEPHSNHFVCHCTDDRIAWCGLDVTHEQWLAPEEDCEHDCPMCLATLDSPLCPFGCGCEDC